MFQELHFIFSNLNYRKMLRFEVMKNEVMKTN
jgi:hypothetical protein